jgi:hypothetical protein
LGGVDGVPHEVGEQLGIGEEEGGVEPHDDEAGDRPTFGVSAPVVVALSPLDPDQLGHVGPPCLGHEHQQ